MSEATGPQTRTARHQRIALLVERHSVRSQAELGRLLAEDGLLPSLDTYTGWPGGPR